jgi:two-component system LytT family response regulator
MPEDDANSLVSAPGIIDTQGQSRYQESIMAKEGTRTIIVPVRDILLFTAASPYVKLHGAKRQFLVTGTLRSLAAQLDPARFHRIHKSAIVQLDAVTEMRSRQNGDYDLILSDGSTTRLSRSFLQGFRKAITLKGGHISADT